MRSASHYMRLSVVVASSLSSMEFGYSSKYHGQKRKLAIFVHIINSPSEFKPDHQSITERFAVGIGVGRHPPMFAISSCLLEKLLQSLNPNQR
jgi:hypothetical protein